MANIIVSASTTNINVDTTTSTVDVSSTISNVLVGETTFVANNIVRAAISVTDTGGDGSLSYDEPTGVITYTGPSAAETRAHFSQGYGITFNSGTGVIETANAEVRGLFSNVAPITYDASTGVIGLEQTLDDLTLKKYQETVVADGTLGGNISLNINDGTIHQVTISGDITGITLANISTGGSATILLTQDGIGGSRIDTTTYPSNWTDWNFTNEFTELDVTAGNWNAINVLYDGAKYYATVITEVAPVTTTDAISQGNVDLNRYLKTAAYGPSQLLLTNFLDVTDGRSTSGITANTDGAVYQVQQPSVALDGAVGFNFTSKSVGQHDESTASGTNFTGQQNIYIGSGANFTKRQTWYRDGSGNLQKTAAPLTVQSSVVDGINILNQKEPTFGTMAGLGLGFLNNAGSGTQGATTDSAFLTFPATNMAGGANSIYHGSLSITNTGSAVLAPRTDNPHIHLTTVGENESSSDAANLRVSIGTTTTDADHLLYVNGKSKFVGNVNVTGEMNVTGNVEVSGNLNYRNVEDLYVRDQSITLNANAATNATVEIIANRPENTSTLLRWNETTDKWSFTNDGSTFYDIPTSTSDLAEGTNLYYTTARQNTDFDTRLATKSTSDLAEGTNLYYTDARFDTRLGTKSTSDLAEGTNLYYTTDRANSAIAAYTGTITNLTGNVTTTANMQANYFIATEEFIGDLEGAISEKGYNNSGAILSKGDAVYVNGYQGDQPNIALANAESAAHMPAVGIVKEDIGIGNTGQFVVSGTMNFASHGFTAGDELFVNGAGTLVTAAPTGENQLIQKIGKALGPNHILVQGAGRTNATPNLNDGKIFLGNASNQAVTAVFTDEANSAIGAYTGDMLSVEDIVANTLLTSNAITSQTTVLVEQQSNTSIGGIKSFEGGTTFTNFNTNQPALNVENGFLAIQASDETSNVFSIPRYVLGKLPDVPAVTASTVDDYGINSGTYDNATYAMPAAEEPTGVFVSTVNKRRAYAIPNYGISYTAEGATPHSTGTIQFGTDNSNVLVQAAQSFGPLAGQPAFLTAPTANGTITFRTIQTDILPSIPSIAPYNDAINFANSTVAYMDSKFNIGREDDGSSYNFPKTKGNEKNYLRLSGQSLEFVSAFGGLVHDQGTVIGDVTFDLNNGDIQKIETAGDITDLLFSNAPVGMRLKIIVKQGSSTGALTGSTNFLWAGGSKTLSTSTGDIDIINITYDGTNYFAELDKGYVA